MSFTNQGPRGKPSAGLTEEVGDKVSEQAVADAVGDVYLTVFRIEREAGGVQDLAERAFDNGVGRHVPAVPDVPHADEAELGIQPRILGRLVKAILERDPRKQVHVQVVGRGKKYLALVH